MAGLSRNAGVFVAEEEEAEDAYGLIILGGPTNTERHYVIAEADFPTLSGTTGWTIGFFFRVDDNSGSNFQYALGGGGIIGSTSSINVWMSEDSASNPGIFSINVEDDAANGTTTVVGTNAYDDGSEYLAVLQSTTSAVQLYVCPVDGSAVEEVDNATSLGDLSPDTDVNFGCRSDENTDRFWHDAIGGLFIVNRNITTGEIEAIAGGADPTTELGANCTHFWAFKDGEVTTETDVVSAVDATRQGTGW